MGSKGGRISTIFVMGSYDSQICQFFFWVGKKQVGKGNSNDADYLNIEKVLDS